MSGEIISQDYVYQIVDDVANDLNIAEEQTITAELLKSLISKSICKSINAIESTKLASKVKDGSSKLSRMFGQDLF